VVESAGVERAEQQMREADLVVWIDAVDQPARPPQIDRPCLWVRNKSDLHSPPYSEQSEPRLATSALRGDGVERVADEIVRRSCLRIDRRATSNEPSRRFARLTARRSRNSACCGPNAAQTRRIFAWTRAAPFATVRDAFARTLPPRWSLAGKISFSFVSDEVVRYDDRQPFPLGDHQHCGLASASSESAASGR
jgi:hypothetical protein